MRPEDVIIAPAAQRFCGANEIELGEVRDARARGQYVWEGQELEEGWYVVVADRQWGVGRLRLLCGPEGHIVADVRLID